VLLGALGGVLVEALTSYRKVVDWQSARHHTLKSGETPPPELTRYVDVKADGLVAVTRLLLGALAGGLLHSQITGSIAAIAVGAAAPAILGQLGRAPALAQAVRGSEDQGDPLPPSAEPASHPGATDEVRS
jgi:hypothetical protein